MKLTTKDKNKNIPVSVTLENKMKYGIVIGTCDNLVGVLLNTGEYVDVPVYYVKRISKKTKFPIT
ncbi:hypothetical protein [Lacrimispora amygdalina]|uniref:hypothetical protein n=1 Tax=Lacrimispora amygdalina TaxID=253257 RepID=UPI000BE424B2|nr:hypothetical protein [Lacrimispora amygdalina]